MLLTSRAIRVLSAFQAVWCLGCTSFDVLLDRALGAAIAQAESCASMENQRPAPADAPRVGSATEQATRTTGCGCDHCIAERTPHWIPNVEPEPVPQSAPKQVSAPLSIERKPLVPPPLA